jgi:xeroderma pigmentosum group C-complementing protein
MLESKLKKYEAYWPPDAGIIGEFRGENVRLRSVVQKVRSKEAWYTQFGRIIKEGEESCKQVKLPKKPEKKRRKFDDEIPMVGPEDAEDVRWQPLYGEWQTEPYSPPIAQDGKVPRNKFGSVDLYLPSMMPIGCVWIKHEHAYIAARDLGVDYAAACVCFAFSGRIAVPRMRGIVICAEYEGPVRKRLKEVEHELICAAAEAEIEAEKKKTRLEKRKKKIMDKIVGEHNIDDQETPGEIISALDPKSKHHLNQLDDNLDDLF